MVIDVNDPLIKKGIELFRQEEYEETIKIFDEAIKTNPKDAVLWFIKGIVLIRLNENEEAIETFDRAIEINPEAPDLFYIFKGLVSNDIEINEDAINALDRIIEMNPIDTYAYFFKGVLLYKLGKYKTAINALDKAIEINPKDNSAHYFLGGIFFNLGNLQEASKKVKDALDIDKNSEDTLCLQGRIKIEELDYNGAIDSFKRAISLDVGNPSFLIWEAYAKYLAAEFSQDTKDEKHQEKAYQEKIISIIRGLERAEKLSQKDGKEEIRAYILYLLGYLYYKGGDFLTAKEKLEECMRLKSKSSLKPASDLLEYIWNNQIRPPLIKSLSDK